MFIGLSMLIYSNTNTSNRLLYSNDIWDSLPFRSEERELLGFGSIPVAILPSCPDMKTVVLYLHEHEYVG